MSRSDGPIATGPGPPGTGTPAAGAGPELAHGWRAPEVEQELPELALVISQARVARGAALAAGSPPGVIERLRELSNRFRGPRAVSVRREPVPAAYRVFYRHIGLDPDVARTPLEEAALERMLHGGFLSGGLLEDVLLIALLDTGVPVWALDADAVDGSLGIRPSGAGATLGRAPDAPPLPAGRLVIADRAAALAVLFGELAPSAAPAGGTTRLLLFALQVPGVPALFVEEALWDARMLLEGSQPR